MNIANKMVLLGGLKPRQKRIITLIKQPAHL
jgi:hypothetical protein